MNRDGIPLSKTIYQVSIERFEETNHIVELLNKSRFGIQITGNTAEDIIPMILGMKEQSPFDRIVTILEALNLVAISGEFRTLYTPGFISAIKSAGSERINKVFQTTYTKTLYPVSE